MRLQTRKKPGGASSALLAWGVIILMVALCLTLTVLQYQWTGQISRAETARLRANLTEGFQAVCLAFDSALTQSCRDLRPGPGEIAEAGFEAAHLHLFESWMNAKFPQMFKRIGYAVPEHGDLKLFMIQPKERKLVLSDWPEEWMPLRRNLVAKLDGPGGSEPFRDRSGFIVEIPVFGDRMRPPPGSEATEETPPAKKGMPEIRQPPLRRARRPGMGEKEWAIFECGRALQHA